MKRRRIETSKAALMGSLIFCALVIAIILIGWLSGRDDALGMLTVIAAIAVLIVRYYMRKAQAENVLKIQRANKLTDAQITHLLDLAERGTKNNDGGGE